jgi:site-specific recombinase XerC
LSELVVNYKAARAIQAYLEARPDSPSQALFLNKFGKPLGNRSVEKAFKKYATLAGIPWAHVESLRTTHITEHLVRKTESTIVQEHAGLTQRQTNHYVQFVKEEQIKAMQEHAL